MGKPQVRIEPHNQGNLDRSRAKSGRSLPKEVDFILTDYYTRNPAEPAPKNALQPLSRSVSGRRKVAAG